VSYPEASKELKVIAWRREEMTVAVAPSHALARKRVIAPADLNGQDYIGFDEDLSIRQALDRFLRENDVAVNLAMQFDNIQNDQGSGGAGGGGEHFAGADHAGGDPARPTGIDPAGCAGPGAAGGDRAQEAEEVQSGGAKFSGVVAGGSGEREECVSGFSYQCPKMGLGSSENNLLLTAGSRFRRSSDDVFSVARIGPIAGVCPSREWKGWWLEQQYRVCPAGGCGGESSAASDARPTAAPSNLKRLIRFQHFIDQQQQGMRHSHQSGSFLSS
jgi:hypothetical protein